MAFAIEHPIRRDDKNALKHLNKRLSCRLLKQARVQNLDPIVAKTGEYQQRL